MVRRESGGEEGRRGLGERLASDPTAWATLLRHALPIAFVLLAGWSALETLVSLVLDAASVLACAAAVASTIAVRALAHDEQDWLDRLNLLAGGIVIFAIVTSLLLLAIGVPATMLWLAALRGREGELATLAREPSRQATFASMLACQVPRYLMLVRSLDERSAGRALAPEVGFVLLRFVLVAGGAGLLALLPAGAALLGALVLVQAVLAVTEVLGDEHLAWLSRELPSGAPPRARRRRG